MSISADLLPAKSPQGEASQGNGTNRLTIEHLPLELLDAVLSYIPVIDYSCVKRAGSRRLTEAVRFRTSQLSHQDFDNLVHQQDEHEFIASESERRPALVIAIQRGNPITLLRYLSKLQDTTKRRGYYRRYGNRKLTFALHSAAFFGSLEIVKLLLPRIHLRCTMTGSTALHLASRRGHLEVARLLIKNGADVNAIDFTEMTPLALAQKWDQDIMAEFLLSQGACLSAAEVLRHHPSRKFADLVWGLTDEPVKVKKPAGVHEPRDENPFTPGRPSIMRTFARYIRVRRDLDPVQKAKRQEALFIFAMIQDFEEVGTTMLDDGLHINTICNLQISILHLAVRHGNKKWVEKLVQRGADPLSTSTFKRRYSGEETPFLAAARLGHMWAVKMFLDSGVSVHAKNSYGMGALHLAWAHPEVFIKAMVRGHGADIEMKNSGGDTPLQVAVQRNFPQVVQCLLDEGAKTNTENIYNATPLMEALSKGLSDIVGLLLRANPDIMLCTSLGKNAIWFIHSTKVFDIFLKECQNPQIQALKEINSQIRATRVEEEDNLPL